MNQSGLLCFPSEPELVSNAEKGQQHSLKKRKKNDSEIIENMYIGFCPSSWHRTSKTFVVSKVIRALGASFVLLLVFVFVFNHSS